MKYLYAILAVITLILFIFCLAVGLYLNAVLLAPALGAISAIAVEEWRMK